MRIVVTGGLGFIGSALVRLLIGETRHHVINLDKVSYASTFGSVEAVAHSERYQFKKCDLADEAATLEAIVDAQPDAIVHLAAESHVDRSIDGPKDFLESNVCGTFNLLQAARHIDGLKKFVHVSTDEVFGALPLGEGTFNEATAYNPHSPYSASKAASDHFARAWATTFDLPVVVTNCSNNYGPYQFPEKLIPLMIAKAVAGEKLPIYGSGENVRDWLYVDDHARALLSALERGDVGETYLVGGSNEKSNLELVYELCDLIDSRIEAGAITQLSVDGEYPRKELVEFVADRPGHDLRYAIDASHIAADLGWKPRVTVEQGLALTVDWYLANSEWWLPIVSGSGATQRIGIA